jgi:hypothetical protein
LIFSRLPLPRYQVIISLINPVGSLIISKSELFVSRAAFTDVGQNQGKRASVITRAWKSTAWLADFMKPPLWGCHTDPLPEAVNFTEVMRGVRFIETGQWHAMLLGQTPWNMVAEINNQDKTPADSDFLVEWIPSLHPQFRNGAARRERAAAQLRVIYAELADRAMSTTVQLDLAATAEA